MTSKKQRNEAVNHPDHYKGSRNIEVIEVVEDWDLNFNLGNAIKYIGRLGRKLNAEPLEDLEKAIWYIEREVKKYKEDL